MYFLTLFPSILFCNVKRWIFTVTCGILFHRDIKEELIWERSFIIKGI